MGACHADRHRKEAKMWHALVEIWERRRRNRALRALAALPPRLLADAAGLEPGQLDALRVCRTPAEAIALLNRIVGGQARRQIGSAILSRNASNAASSSAEGAWGRGARSGRLTTIAASGPAPALSSANTSPGSRPPLSSR